MSSVNTSINKTRSGYKSEEIDTLRNFYLNMLDTLPEPQHSYEVVNYVNTLGLVILYTYPEYSKLDNRYYVGQNKVSLFNSYLGSIVSLRNVLNHANGKTKWLLAVKTFVSHGSDDSRYEGVPLNIKKYCVNLEKVNIGTFINYIQALFNSSKDAKDYNIVAMKIKVPRGRRHKFDESIVMKCRMLAPEVYKDLPEAEFCVAMWDTLVEMERESI